MFLSCKISPTLKARRAKASGELEILRGTVVLTYKVSTSGYFGVLSGTGGY